MAAITPPSGFNPYAREFVPGAFHQHQQQLQKSQSTPTEELFWGTEFQTQVDELNASYDAEEAQDTEADYDAEEAQDTEYEDNIDYQSYPAKRILSNFWSETQYSNNNTDAHYQDYSSSMYVQPDMVATMDLPVERSLKNQLGLPANFSVSETDFYASWSLGMPFFIRVVKQVEAGDKPGFQFWHHIGHSGITEESPTDDTIAVLKVKNDAYEVNHFGFLLKKSSENCLQKYRIIYTRFQIALEQVNDRSFSTDDFLALARSLPNKGKIVATKSGTTYLKISKMFTDGLTKVLPTDIPYYDWQQYYNPAGQFEQLGAHMVLRVPADEPNMKFYKKAVKTDDVASFKVVSLSDTPDPQPGISREIVLDVHSKDLETMRKNMGLQRYVDANGFRIVLVKA